MKKNHSAASKEERWEQKLVNYNIRAGTFYLLALITFLLIYIAFKVVH